MAASKPIISVGCKHDNKQPLPLSTDAIKLVTQTWTRVQGNGLLMAGAAVFRRLNEEATQDELYRMDNYFIFLDKSPCPMKEHCCLIMNTLDEVIMSKINCVSCIRETLKKISQVHSMYGLDNHSDLFKPVQASVKQMLEDILQEEFSAAVKSAWEEFLDYIQNATEE